MTKAEFIRIWHDYAVEHDLISAEALICCVKDYLLDFDRLDDRALAKKLENAFDRYVWGEEDIGEIFMKMSEENLVQA